MSDTDLVLVVGIFSVLGLIVVVAVSVRLISSRRLRRQQLRRCSKEGDHPHAPHTVEMAQHAV